MGCLWRAKYSRQCKTMPSGPPEFVPPFIWVTGMKCSYGKISRPLTEISGTEPARPLMWHIESFRKDLEVKARSRKPGSYQEAISKRFPGMVLAELWRAKRGCGAPWVSKSTHPRKFGNHVTVHRPQPARPSAPQENQCSISHFLASLVAQED